MTLHLYWHKYAKILNIWSHAYFEINLKPSCKHIQIFAISKGNRLKWFETESQWNQDGESGKEQLHRRVYTSKETCQHHEIFKIFKSEKRKEKNVKSHLFTLWEVWNWKTNIRQGSKSPKGKLLHIKKCSLRKLRTSQGFAVPPMWPQEVQLSNH